jgi:hypothetical protein
MATALDSIKAAMREIGVLAAGEEPTGAEASEALDTLNRLIDQWAAERLEIFTITRTTLAIANNDSYPVGPSTPSPVQAWFNMVRPMFIDHVSYVVTTATPDQEVPIQPLTEQGWQNLPLKAQTGTIPQFWYYNPTYPNGTLHLWPILTDSGLTIALYAPTAVVELAALTTEIQLPPGYERMIVKNLALELAPSYSRKVDPMLLRQAADARAVVKASNHRLSDMSFPADALIGHGRGRFNVWTGQ